MWQCIIFEPQEPPVISDSAPINDESKVNRCFCGRINLIDTYMLDCDRCHGWFHSSCVGIARDEVPSYWICDKCKIQIMIIDQSKLLASACNRAGNKSGQVDDTLVLRQLLLNHLTFLASGVSDAIVAREFLLAKWIDQFQSEEKQTDHRADVGGAFSDSSILCAHFFAQWIPSEPPGKSAGCTQISSNIEGNQLTEEGNARIFRALAATSEFALSFPNLLGVIVKLMGDDNANAFRKLAVKAVAQVCQYVQTNNAALLPL